MIPAGMLARVAPWLLPLVTAWGMFCTLRAAAFARIRSLHVVESYGFAVYEQLIHNKAFAGHFFQTVHRGYIDHWMWSGHRSVFLYVAAWIYGFAPVPLTLSTIQVALVSLGCLPAFGLGRAAIGGVLGGGAGLLLYAAFPPLWAIALNDYQEIVLGVPFALAAGWALRERSRTGFFVAALLCACTREEWAMTLPLLGLAAPGGWRPRAWGVLTGLGAAGVFAAVAWYLGRDAVGYETPMNTQAAAVFGHLPPIQRTWADWDRFYVYFLKPINGVAALAPLTLLPGLGAFFVHLTTPNGSGIDADWRGHIHHMAPVATFLIAGAIDGLGVLAALVFPMRSLPRWRAALELHNRAPLAVKALLVIGLAGAFWIHDPSWLRMLRLTPTLSPALHEPADAAPEWAVVATLPREAVVATDQDGALLVSGFTRSFTYGESLPEKSRLGLAELDYLLVNKRDSTVFTEATAMGGTVVTETQRYRLVKLPKAARLDSAEAVPAG